MFKKLTLKRIFSMLVALIVGITSIFSGIIVSAEGEPSMTADKTTVEVGETISFTLSNIPDGTAFAIFTGNEKGDIVVGTGNYITAMVSGTLKENLTSANTSVSASIPTAGYYVAAIWGSGWSFYTKILITVTEAAEEPTDGPLITAEKATLPAGGTFKFTISGITDSVYFAIFPGRANGAIDSYNNLQGYRSLSADTSVSISITETGYYVAAIWNGSWNFLSQVPLVVTEPPSMSASKTEILAGETIYYVFEGITEEVEFGLLPCDENGENLDKSGLIFWKMLSVGTTTHSTTVTTPGYYIAAIWGSGWSFISKILIKVEALPASVESQVIYVSSANGNDANDGTADMPKKTLTAAIGSITTVNGTVVISDKAVYSDEITARSGAVTVKGLDSSAILEFDDGGIVLKSNTAFSSLTLKQTVQNTTICTNGYSFTTDDTVSYIGNGSEEPVFEITHTDGNSTLIKNIGIKEITVGTDLNGEIAVAYNSKDGYKAVAVTDDTAEVKENENIIVNDNLSTTEYKYNNYSKYINYRKPLTNTYKKLTQDKNINILYLGGSVTAGYGVSTGGWRGSSMNWFKSNFPDANINFTNTAIGESGTFLGTYRIKKDVIDKAPDLLFIEYAINDTYKGSTKEEAALQYETIIREVKAALPKCEIITLLVTDRTRYSPDELYPTAAGHEEIAAKYNIPTLNVGSALLDSMTDYTDNTEWNEYFLDNDYVHPDVKGYAVYFDCLQEYLRNMLLYTSYTGIEANRDVLLPVQSANLLDGDRISAFGAEMDALITENTGFTYSSDLFYGPADTPHNGYYYSKNGTDASITFKFKGTEFAFWTNFYNTSSVKYSIDNGEFVTINCDRHAPTQVITGLSSGEHTITIVPLTYGSESADVFKIGAIFVRDAAKQSVAGEIDTYNDGINRVVLSVNAQTDIIEYLSENAVISDLSIPIVSENEMFTGWKNSLGEYISPIAPLFTSLSLTADIKLTSDAGDGVTNIKDLVRLKKYVAGIIGSIGEHADYNGDGKINAIDIVSLRLKLLNS